MSRDVPPWQQRTYAQAVAALDAGRLPHGLLLAGPAGLGKLAVARRLAGRLLCRSPSATDACGQCRSCQLLAAGTHPDLLEETLELNDNAVLRREILIAQIRRLTEKLMLTPHLAMGQVALIHPAEAMNRATFNAVLKTLEEPPPGRYLILLSHQPQRLPATIRSRCQVLRMDLPPLVEASAYLRAGGHATAEAAQALDAAQGNPGLAAQYLANGGLALRQNVARDLVALAHGAITVAELAPAWSADQLDLRLRFAGELLRDHLARRAGRGGSDLLHDSGRTAQLDTRALADWFDASLRCLSGLEANLNTPLQTAELLQRWRQLHAN
ncbi:MAG TPA: DNA polymerase III subunit delta' [Chiayiivirga sp.]|nr:DNA polymerase III subunit delta' [Chiayiivirga sp.]